jgi:hypothetical protein
VALEESAIFILIMNDPPRLVAVMRNLDCYTICAWEVVTETFSGDVGVSTISHDSILVWIGEYALKKLIN